MLTKLKLERQKRGIKAKDLARKAGIHNSYLTKIEQGLEPSIDVKRRICKAIGLPSRTIWNNE